MCPLVGYFVDDVIGTTLAFVDKFLNPRGWDE
jgi:hypothetical protein